MAAGKQEGQSLVGKIAGGVLRRATRRLLKIDDNLKLLLLAGERGVAAEAIDSPAPGDSVEPGRGIMWDALGRPLLQRGDAGVLQGVFGEGKVANGGDERGQNRARLLAEDTLDD